MIHVGETLLYTHRGHTTYAKVKEVFLADDNKLQFKVVTTAGDEIITTRESLCDPEAPDIGWIPTTVPEVQNAAAKLTEEEIETVLHPVKLSPLQEEWLALHKRLWHLPFEIMF